MKTDTFMKAVRIIEPFIDLVFCLQQLTVVLFDSDSATFDFDVDDDAGADDDDDDGDDDDEDDD